MGVIWQKALGGKLGLASNLSIFSEKATVVIPVLFATQPWKGLNVLFSLAGQHAPALPSLCPAQFSFAAELQLGSKPLQRERQDTLFFSPDLGRSLSITLLAVPSKTFGCTTPGFWRQVRKLSPQRPANGAPHPPVPKLLSWLGLGFVCKDNYNLSACLKENLKMESFW